MTISSGLGTSNIVVEVRETVKNVEGEIKVRGVNDCGYGDWSIARKVIITPLPKVSAGDDINYCPTDGDAITLTGKADIGVGTWEALTAGPQGTQAGNSFNVRNLMQGDNYFRWTVSTDAGCTASDQVVVRNNELNVTASKGQSLICDGQTTLSGTSIPDGCSGLWTIQTAGAQGQFANASDASTAFTNLSKGEITVRWTITQNGCQSYDDVTLVNSQPDEPTITIVSSTDDEGTEKAINLTVAISSTTAT